MFLGHKKFKVTRWVLPESLMDDLEKATRRTYSDSFLVIVITVTICSLAET
jgi:hypothetical protein